MRPSPASCSESSSAPTPRRTSTTARPSPRYTAARRAERYSFNSPSQAVAHHPRRERRRLASASPASCAGAVLWKSQARTSRHLTTPKRLARVARPLPRPSRRSWRPDPAATHLSAFSEVMRPLTVHAFSPKPRRQAAAPVQASAAPRAGGRLSAAAGCGEHTVPWSPTATTTQRRDYRNRGEAIAPAARPRPVNAIVGAPGVP